MLNDLWNGIHSSVCSITFTNAAGDRLSSGTGYRTGNYIITNNHVIQVPGARRVSIRFVEADGHTTLIQRDYGRLEFQQFLVDGDPEDSWDYAILAIDDPEILARPALQLTAQNQHCIGRNVALFGYQFDQPNQSVHSGIISSTFSRAGVDYLQLDSSINNGNSGGPLIDIDSAEVIGIVTRKATGLTEEFDKLIESFRDNIAALEQSRGMVGLAGIDPIRALIATQVQMSQVSIELKRSSNVGIGYAYNIRKIREGLQHLGRYRQVKSSTP